MWESDRGGRCRSHVSDCPDCHDYEEDMWERGESRRCAHEGNSQMRASGCRESYDHGQGTSAHAGRCCSRALDCLDCHDYEGGLLAWSVYGEWPRAHEWGTPACCDCEGPMYGHVESRSGHQSERWDRRGCVDEGHLCVHVRWIHWRASGCQGSCGHGEDMWVNGRGKRHWAHVWDCLDCHDCEGDA